MVGCDWTPWCAVGLLSTCTAYPLLPLLIQNEFPLSPVFLPPDVAHKLGPYSPYYAVSPYEILEQECNLTQANLLYRHGSRYPTRKSAIDLAETFHKLQANKLGGALKFITNYSVNLNADDLVLLGAMELEEAGRRDYARYSQLLPNAPANEPFLRATSAQRVIDSAGNWSAAFTTASGGTFHVPLPLILKRSQDFNNTLGTYNCPQWNRSLSDEAKGDFLASFAPDILHRLQEMAPTAELGGEDVINLFQMCAFDSVASMKYSPFCRIFEPEEFDQFEYYEDVSKYYYTGYGHALGPVQGVAYVAELVARLTSSPVHGITNINRTLDSSSDTFPLDRNLYVDFSHDNTMVAIVSAMGIHKPQKHLSTHKRQQNSAWVISRIAPFAARLVVEKYSCTTTTASGSDEWVRVLSDDAVMNLPDCKETMPGGLCSLQSFVREQLGYVYSQRAIADWDNCF
ncbi:acid phosphatase [Cantharellus anzutake]|uniref:acid phosphatase n=1 Tax=Cantharellus anzutake TaxID=1750568 RepID=UPI0019055A9F|nr:acid phosphatase [Cantharellus anzutake]KAF8328232.1 acid phosphatase [Cantharellus anzutake]